MEVAENEQNLLALYYRVYDDIHLHNAPPMKFYTQSGLVFFFFILFITLFHS